MCVAWALPHVRKISPPERAHTGADKVCLSISGDSYGQVFYWDGYQNDGQRVFKVAPTFESFIGSLFRDEHSPQARG
jgi:hypothetical protein